MGRTPKPPITKPKARTITRPKARKTSQSKPPSLMQQIATKRDKVAQNAIDSAFNTAGKIAKAGSKTTIKKGGPRPARLKVANRSQSEARKAAMGRTAERMKPKRKPLSTKGR